MKCVVVANVRRHAYFPSPIPRYYTLQQHSDRALEALEYKAGCKVEKYSFCEQKKKRIRGGF